MSSTPQAPINVNSLPFSDAQKVSIQKRGSLVENASAFLNPNLTDFETQADARPVVRTSIPFVAYPANGTGPVDILAYTVPRGLLLVIRYVAIVHIGGNPPDGSGNVVWRALLNGGAVKGMEGLTSQLGTYAQPNRICLVAYENDFVEFTVEVPGGQPDMPVGTTTAARFHGYTYPLIKATSAEGGTQ